MELLQVCPAQVRTDLCRIIVELHRERYIFHLHLLQNNLPGNLGGSSVFGFRHRVLQHFQTNVRVAQFEGVDNSRLVRQVYSVASKRKRTENTLQLHAFYEMRRIKAGAAQR
ncbi:hypothetical protein SDC9_104752 [bioreactor metagenome]|uniref:Uncharacterized protein n=1 Tax=bioreactor metagenome TaxID=1076179 RepID=A0A645B440_9ZZZZ